MTQTVLILGASGRFGRNAARAFEAAGWAVRLADRRKADLSSAARGADVIVHGWNPAYPDWARDLPAITRRVIALARQSGATVIVPGNVYVFGADTPAPWGPDTPHAARNPLGRLRVEMEAAFAASGVRTIVLRAGDFIDTERSGNWFDRILTAKIDKGLLTYPGNPDAPHAWAYLPDLARACVELAEMRDRLPAFTDLSFPGYTLTGRELAAGLARATGRDIGLSTMSWWLLGMLRPFWKMARPLLEMRYLWDVPHRLDGDAFAALLPDFRNTPLEAALLSALPKKSGPKGAGRSAFGPARPAHSGVTSTQTRR